jgi:hypothetical protein
MHKRAVSGTAEDAAIKKHLRGAYGFVGVTESTFADNMFFSRHYIPLSIIYFKVNLFCEIIS